MAVSMLTQTRPWRSSALDWKKHIEFPGKQVGNSSSSGHKGVRWRLSRRCHDVDTAQLTDLGLSDHCLPVLFLSSLSSITMKKGNLTKSGAATRQRATSASMVCAGMGEGKIQGLKLQPGGQRGQFLSHTCTHRDLPATRGLNLAFILFTNKKICKYRL